MSPARRIVLMMFLSAAAWCAPAREIPPAVQIQFLGTKRPSSFPKLLLVRVSNQGYTPIPLVKSVAASQLIIDGQPSRRTSVPVTVPQGLPPVGEWVGCLTLEAFDPPLTRGKHKVSLRLGGSESNLVTVRWEPPLNWRQGNLKSRLKEVQDLAKALFDGLPRDCAEKWLTVKDGGLADEDKVRYYLEPNIKVVVPYREAYEAGRQRVVVDGPAVVYQEAPLTD